MLYVISRGIFPSLSDAEKRNLALRVNDVLEIFAALNLIATERRLISHTDRSHCRSHPTLDKSFLQMPTKLNACGDSVIKRIRYLMFGRLLISQNRVIPRPESAIPFPLVIFRLSLAATGAVTRTEWVGQSKSRLGGAIMFYRRWTFLRACGSRLLCMLSSSSTWLPSSHGHDAGAG
jgi:hypothetical protein